MSLTPAETAAARALIVLALAEDLGDTGDRTSLATIPADATASAAFVARSPGVVAGLPVAELVCAAVDSSLLFHAELPDGSPVQKGTRIATVSGSLRNVLVAERTALNFLQRLSGVATLTRQFADAVDGLPVQILDTRKTTPGWRLLEKLAVRAGGGTNHRIGLYDAILIKENHITAAGGVTQALKAASLVALQASFVEIEVETLEQLREALDAGATMVLLDNMSLPTLREAVAINNGRAILEISGGVTLDGLRGLAETGVDRISVGALTKDVKATDFSMRLHDI